MCEVQLQSPTNKKRKVCEEIDELDDDYFNVENSEENKLSLSRSCPYLDTINRNILDFDFEKLCSISLHHLNVYACLICGKYFQGRGSNTYAHTHALSEDHHVFLNLESRRFYCLPDNYEIIDGSLEDIKYLLNPHFTEKDIRELDSVSKLVRAYDGNTYYPGVVCLNNIKAVVICSKKRFQFTEQGDCLEFLSWLLNSLDHSLRKEVPGKHKVYYPTIINQSLTGSMHVFSRKVIPLDLSVQKRLAYMNDPEYTQDVVTESKFVYLTCDLPPPPLYPDELKKNIIPQVPLFNILSKFNGITEKEYKFYKESVVRRFVIQKLPQYLCLYIKRIVKNLFTIEKNPTIVNFPIKGVDFGEYLTPPVREKHRHTTYNLIANIVHDGPPTPGAGSHRIHILHKGTGKWFELQDLHVKEILPQMITLSESLIQVWEVDKSVNNPAYLSAKDRK